MKIRLLLLVGCVLLNVPARAQVSADAAATRSGDALARVAPAVQAARRPTDIDIDIDGRLTDAAWADATSKRLEIQGQPIEGDPAEQPTDVWVVFDHAAIYVGARMYDPTPETIGDQLVRRDENGQYDYFEVSLDPNRDGLTGYRFRVSAAGVQRDVYMYQDVQEDVNWNAVWESGVQRDSLGWTAEMRIPLSQVRYNAADSVQTWGVNFSRRRLSSNEISFFSLESRVRHGKVSVFGNLEGLQLPGSGARIELRPYALTSARTAESQVGNPFFDGSEFGTRAGMDMRFGLGAAHTLDVSINPDFGQVEVDPAVVNLSAFETFFPEKRPFFVEDAQIFDFTLAGRQNTLFYSRRIGRSPQGGVPSGFDFQDGPTQTSILGAAKLTGRTPGGLSMGAMAAVTGRERARAFDGTSGEIEQFTVEPRSEYGVIRLQQDLRGGATTFGGIFTAMNRELPNDGSFDFLTKNAYSVGIDFEHNWGGPRSRNWALSGFWGGTRIQGPAAALTRIQRSSNHFFQRPDATRFSVDTLATSMQGMEWRLEFERRSGKHWTGGVWAGQATPAFEINDLGFSRSNERLDIGGRLSYREIQPGKVFRSYRFSAFTFHNFRHEALDDAGSWASWQRAHKAGTFSLSADLEFLNWWRLNLSGRYSPQLLSDNATRGGPLMVKPSSATFTVRGNTDRRKTVALSPMVTYANRQFGGYQWRTQLGLTFRPAPSWEFQLQPSYSIELQTAQYVTAADEVGYDPTYGARYLFSDLKRNSFSLETRINMAFSPTLTLQLYAQPLISSGRYLTTKQLERAESYDFDVFEEGTAVVANDDVSCVDGRTCVDGSVRYVDFEGDGTTDLAFSDRNFNVRSLRMNLVLRWEYRPGSTIFLVWQQNRSSRVNDGSFDVGRDFRDLFNVTPENLFILKFTYWLGL